MNFTQFLLVLRARKRIMLTTMFSVTALILIGSLLWPNSYKATASVVLNYKGIDPVTGMTMPGQLLPGYVATQLDIIGSKKVALGVVDSLRLASSPAVIEQFNAATDGKGTARDWLADLLLKKLDAQPSRESSVVEISFSGSDPQFAAAVANAFAEEYQKVNVQLKVDPMRKASVYFNEQTKLLRDNVDAAQSRLSKYQQEHGIVSLDNRLDVESNRLNDLSAQLVLAQGQLAEANSRQNMAAGSNGAESPDVATNPLIQNLKANLNVAESKFAEVAQRLSPNHPQYQSSKAELDKLRAELQQQTKVISNSVGNNAAVLRQREASIRASLAEQKTKVLELNRTRDELAGLQKDAESAQRAYDATSQRLSQTKIEGQSEQSDVAILNPAVAPIAPSSPRPLLNTIIGLFLGAIIGLAIGLLRELLDRRVRSDSDLVSLTSVPLLGTINWSGAPEPSRIKKIFLPRKLRLN